MARDQKGTSDDKHNSKGCYTHVPGGIECNRVQSPGRHAGPCAHADFLISDCRACCHGPEFLGVHDFGLQLCPKRPFGPSAYGFWRAQHADSHRSACACLLKSVGNADASTATCQHTAEADEEWQARHCCDCS